MLFQLHSMGWDGFKAHWDHRVTPEEVLILLAELRQNNLDKMCVILCVDSFDKLGHESASGTSSSYHSARKKLDDLVNTSRCRLIIIGSSTIHRPVREFLLDSLVWHIQVPTVRLSRSTIDGLDGLESLDTRTWVD